MTAEDIESPRPGDGGADATGGDARMAEILGGGQGSRRRARERLTREETAEAADLLDRLNALDFVDSVVGDVSDIPDRIGDYRVTGLLGRGGMGTVYAAFQESLEREVALKVLAPGFAADVTMRQRFKTEARATASLHHEHIVPVYDFGEAHGVLFFTMEKVNGVSLDKHIAAARRRNGAALSPRQAAERFAGVAEALHHAHRRGIVHRDVKPGNLLVGVDGTLALADFGLSKIAGEHSRSLTVGGGFLGTLSYAPPEQARGERPGPAGDLYSLGVTLFEAITGQLPLRGDNTEAMLDALLHGEPRRLRELAPKAPRDLEAVLDKLLQKDPRDRYENGEELARDLRRVAEGEPVRVRRQPLWLRVWRRAAKNPHLTATLAVASVLALVSFALVVVNWRVRRDAMVAQHENLLQQAMAAAARSPGPAAGPPGLLVALAGVALGTAPVDDEVLSLLDRAQAALPDAERPGELRAAYVADPLPQATAYLMQGRGHRARALLDAAIAAASKGFVERDDVTWLRLYRLHLARATACLTASVAELEAARQDLFAASFIRPGAFLPKLLLVFVDGAATGDIAEIPADVTALVAAGPVGAAGVACVLLEAFSGLGRRETAHLMHIEIPYPARRALLAVARELPVEGVPPATPGDHRWTGLEAVLADIAEYTLLGTGAGTGVSPGIAEGLDLLRDEVSPSSPLRSWELVLRTLRDPAGVLEEDRGLSLSPALQMRAWLDLLALRPPRHVVAGIAGRIEALLQLVGDGPRTRHLRAELARRVGTPAELLAAAQAWLELEPDAPGPLLCRFEALVESGRVEDAGFCGAALLQRVSDRSRVLPEVLRILDAAIRPGTASAAAWRSIRAQFAEVAG